MSRKKVNLTYITDDSKRKASLKTRKNGLINKVDEISTLCGIETCAIIYTPKNLQAEVWPSNSGVQSVLSRYGEVSEVEQSRKKVSQESFLKERIVKAQTQLKELKDEIRKKDMSFLMFQYLNLDNIFHNATMTDLNNSSDLIDQHLAEIEKKISMNQTQEMTPVGEDGGKTIGQGEQTPGKTNVDAIQK